MCHPSLEETEIHITSPRWPDDHPCIAHWHWLPEKERPDRRLCGFVLRFDAVPCRRLLWGGEEAFTGQWRLGGVWGLGVVGVIKVVKTFHYQQSGGWPGLWGMIKGVLPPYSLTRGRPKNGAGPLEERTTRSTPWTSWLNTVHIVFAFDKMLDSISMSLLLQCICKKKARGAIIGANYIFSSDHLHILNLCQLLCIMSVSIDTSVRKVRGQWVTVFTKHCTTVNSVSVFSVLMKSCCLFPQWLQYISEFIAQCLWHQHPQVY